MNPSTILHKISKFFLKLHYLAFFYVFLVNPLLLAGYMGLYLTWPFILLVHYAPIGPLSLATWGLFGLFAAWAGLFAPWVPVCMLSAIVFIKFVLYWLLRGTRVLNHSTPKTLITITIAVYILLVIATIAFLYDIMNILYSLYWALYLSFPIDVVVFSYVKYRDAISGRAPRRWVPILVVTWSVPVCMLILAKILWSMQWILDYAVIVWAGIAVGQILFAVKYYYAFMRC